MAKDATRSTPALYLRRATVVMTEATLLPFDSASRSRLIFAGGNLPVETCPPIGAAALA
jgi:hypothetical protein